MNFNDLTLEQQVDVLTENAGAIGGVALMSFASKLGEMSENEEKLYIASLVNDAEGIATITLGKPLWFVFTDESKLDFLPETIKNQIVLRHLYIKDILNLFMRNTSAEGIAFNPFSNEKGIFFANRQVITLAW